MLPRWPSLPVLHDCLCLLPVSLARLFPGGAGLTANTAAGRQEAASGHSLPHLSKKLAQQHSHGNLLFVTWANQHYVPFAANWAHYARAAGINNFLVGELLPCACSWFFWPVVPGR